MRPVKENADYFSHDADASNDEKVMYLESRFGFTGYAFYFKLLEILTRSNNFRFPVNELSKGVLSKKIGVTIQLFNEILAECLRDEIKAFAIEDNFLFSPGLLKRMACLQEKRKKRRENYLAQFEPEIAFIPVSPALTPVCDPQTTVLYPHNPQRKVKESTEKNSCGCSITTSDNSAPDIGGRQSQIPRLPAQLDSDISECFTSCLGFSPNNHQLDEVRKQYFDDRFTDTENMEFIRSAFHKAALHDASRRNTAYVLGIIRSLKTEFLNKRSRSQNRLSRANSPPKEIYSGGIFDKLLDNFNSDGKSSDSPSENSQPP